MASPFFIIANWKSNKTIEEAIKWVEDISVLWKQHNIPEEQIKVILCAPFLHLSTVSTALFAAELPIKLGTQDISPFENGAYTGAISAEMLKNVVQYSLIGHSERRKYFKEADEELFEKVKQAKLAGIEPIYCISAPDAVIPSGIKLVGYEPVWAIGSGKSETAENASTVAANIRSKIGTDTSIIYGGSVNLGNIKEYKNANLNGVLVGKVSLDPTAFMELIAQAL